jgi:tRNA dimethylallyltransferase
MQTTNRKPHTENRIIFIVGPTATGKSEVAVALAKKLKSEIISCDSMQVYKGMEICTSQPSREARKKIPHHLIASLSAEKEYSAAIFRKKSLQLIKKLHAKQKIPIFAGGTGFYLRALVDGLCEEIGADSIWRKRFSLMAEKFGNQYLYRILERLDPEAARKIHPNDSYRIIRALEIYNQTKKPLSETQAKTFGLSADYKVSIFAIKPPREILYQRIDQRVEEMLKLGLEQEIRKLLKKKLSLTAGKALGIREIKGYLEKEYDLEEAKYLLKRNTRHYAKRQLTWFRKDKRIIWLDASKERKELVEEICQKINPV